MSHPKRPRFGSHPRPPLASSRIHAQTTEKTIGRFGRGLEAVADEEAYSLAADLLGSRSGRRRYVLRGVGDSMVDARISDGDLLVVEEDEEPEDGAVVVALLGGGDEVTVKKLYREGELVRLRPENKGHEDIVVSARDVVVQGRAVGVIHPLGRGL